MSRLFIPIFQSLIHVWFRGGIYGKTGDPKIELAGSLGTARIRDIVFWMNIGSRVTAAYPTGRDFTALETFDLAPAPTSANRSDIV